MTQVIENKTTIPQLPKEFVEKYRGFDVPWGPLGYVTYKRTYSRPVVPESLSHIDGYYNQLKAYREITGDPSAYFRTEEWWETTERCVNWYLKEAKGAVDLAEGMQLYDDVMNLRCCFAGRGLWQYGTATVERIGSASLANCYFVAVDNIDSFLFTFDMLMLGGGVGFNIQKEHVFSLPKVRGGRVIRKESNDANFIVPDSREGWIELLARVFNTYFEDGEDFSYSTVCIRPAGTPIASFGGTASGPEPLCTGIQQICSVLDDRTGKKLRPRDCMDIMNIIGSVVVAGNVRRSSQIALGDHEDTHFLLAKRFDLKAQVPNWRAMSNNTVVCNDIAHLPNKFWQTYEKDKDGNPREAYGLFNLRLSKEKGRLKDSHRKDPKVLGTNPCGEVSLNSGESCNLAEIYLPNISTKQELIDVATRLWKVTKVVSCVPHHWGFANTIIQENHRTGLGITGVVQVLAEGHFDDTFENCLDETYQNLEKTDEEFSAALTEAYGRKIGTSVKLTTVKPSGTLSLLPGVTPGVHPAYSQYYIRRIRLSSTSPIVEAARQAGYPVELSRRFDNSVDSETSIIEFPVATPEGTILAENMTALQQLELIKTLQTYWSDNAVSCTVYYREEELGAIKEWLANNYKDGIKSVSFLLHSDHGFLQAPYEEITEKEFLRRAAKLKPLDLSSSHDELYDDEACATGACPIR